MARFFNSRKSSSTFGSRTDVGCFRETNEDSLIVTPPLYVVCDGMGGHAAGEVASEIAVKVIAERAPETPDAEALGQAVEEANLAIIQSAHEGIGKDGMGTTCTAAILEKDRLVIAQVGDSRAYLLSKGRLQQLTRDHSLMADLIEAGQITPEEARVHPRRSVITRALGSDPRTLPDLYELNVEGGDRLLLCSDGLTSMLTDNQIKSILGHTNDPQLCAAQLVNEAIAAGGYDNITVIVVDVEGTTEKKRRRVARKTKIIAVILILVLALIVFGAVYLYNYFSTNSAYLVEEDGKVAIYQGLQGDVFGISSSKLYEITDVEVDDLEPGVANRLRSDGIKVDSIEAAEDLVETYEQSIEEKQAMTSSGNINDADIANTNSNANANSNTNTNANASADNDE
ncbi:MAG: Stp1/IreP family PP2C-type Ser/Thr phosphatase [Eggerthellaceae bacterium]|nr:Stp1/IreP family PP2C-type Ser/Thr phosphatase [Eggerthellaceae bacterium]